MPIYQFNGHVPVIPASCYIAPEATIIGAVVLGERVTILFGAVVRGDNEMLRIGRGSNIQDGSVVHTDMGYPVTLGERVTVGHQVMLHGCTVGDESLIGIQSILLNGSKIGKHCLVGAGSLVTAGSEFPDGTLIMGRPAKVVRQLTPEQIEGLRHSAEHYIENARRFKSALKRIG